MLGEGSLKFKMITLLINICKEKLHYLEFVKPIEDILKREKISFFTKCYKELTQKDLDKSERVIICGTSLKDNEFIENLDKFKWLKDFSRPILGICGGMQIIGKVFGGNIRKEQEIGFFHEKFHRNFLGLEGSKEVYHLHNYYLDFNELDEFTSCSVSDKDILQAVKHNTKDIYGVLFHPEVRQKEMIINFAKV
jgi:GMP synthase (glutamine-hydrolysing)